MHIRALAVIAVVVTAASSFGCMVDRSGIRVTDATELRTKGRPTFGAPFAIPNSTAVVFPFAVEFGRDSSQEFFGSFGSGFISGGSVSGLSFSSGYSGSDSLRWNNVVFYDPNTGHKHLLLDEPATITRFHTNSEKGPVRDDYILFAAATRDTNGDGLVNGADAVILYWADWAGTTHRAVTKPNEQLEGVACLEGTTYLRVRKDSDRDHRFTDTDRIDTYRIRLSKIPPTAEPELVLDDALRQQAFDIVLKAAKQPAAK